MIDMIPENFELISAGKITADNLDFIHEKINGKFYHGRKIVGEL
jgi:hypothetical protein